MYKKQTVWKFIIFTILLLFTAQLSAVKAAENKSTQNTRMMKETAVFICAFPGTFPGTTYTTYLPTIISPLGDAPTPSPMARELQYEVGKTYSYDYQFSSYAVFGTVDKENGVSDTTPNVTLYYGTAQVSITGFEGGDIFVGQIMLENPVGCSQNGDNPDESLYDDEDIDDLQTPVLFRQHKNGVIVDVQISNDVDEVTINQLKGILNALQATLTEDNDYPAIENSVQGSLIAHYTAVLQQNGTQFTKTADEGSFINFYSQGDDPAITLENSVHSFLERETGVFSRISFHETTTILQNPEDIDPETIEGVALWGNTDSTGVMKLTAVENTPPQRTAVQMSNYHSADIGSVFAPMTEDLHDIDIDNIDIDAELDAFEADPNNTELFQRLTWIITASGDSDSDNATLNAIVTRLDATLTRPTQEAIALSYIDLLGHDGSSYAQDQLANAIDPNNPDILNISTRLQEQAIVNLALVETPLPVTYNIMQAIMDDPTGAVNTQTTANAALGAMVPNLRKCDPTAADAIYDDLKSQLASATTDEEKYHLLIALGNTESSDLLPVVQPYIVSANAQVQWAAYWALRDVPGQESEDLLLAAFDNTPEGFPQPGAALALKNKPGKPSDNVNEVLAGYYGDENPWPTPEGGVFKKPWEWNIGGKALGADFPGDFVWKSPPETEHLEAVVTQNIDYHLNPPEFNYHHHGTLAHATAFTRPKKNNNAIQEFGYTYSVLGKSFGATYSVPCADADSGVISSGTREVVHAEFNYTVFAGVTVGVGLDATGHYSIDYNYNWDVCNVTAMSAEVNLIPQGDIHVTAKGQLAVLRNRGGVELVATVVDAKIPAKLWATFSLQDDFEACLEIPVEWEVLNVNFNAFRDKYSFTKKDWIRKKTWLLWDLPPVSSDTAYIISPICYQPGDNP